MSEQRRLPRSKVKGIGLVTATGGLLEGLFVVVWEASAISMSAIVIYWVLVGSVEKNGCGCGLVVKTLASEKFSEVSHFYYFDDQRQHKLDFTT